MTSSARPDLSVWRFARAQHQVITRAQLHALGFTHSAIVHREREGRLWRVHADVFAIGRRDLSREGEWMAAVLACGDGAALSHLSAAALWEIWEGVRPRWPQVSVPTGNGRRGPRGVSLRRTRTLTPDDVTTRDRIPVTTLPRTLLDLTTILTPKQLRSALRQSERLHHLDLPRLSSSLDALPPSSPKRARLQRALDQYVPGTAGTEGDLEAVFLELCSRHGIPLPETQVPVGPYHADFMWPDLGLVVEIDDRGSHDGYVAFTEDRRRDRHFKRASLDVMRFTGNELRQEPDLVADETKAARTRRAASKRDADGRGWG